MKNKIRILLVTLTALVSVYSFGQSNCKVDTFNLKNKFSMPDSYLNFRFDYDSLRIDTVQYRSGIDKYTIRYYGYKYELDSFSSDNNWIKTIDLEERFRIDVSDGVLTFIQEMYRDASGIGVTSYELGSPGEPNIKMYRSFKFDGPEFMILSDSLNRRVSIDNANVYLDSARNVTKFYHLNEDLEIVESLNGQGINSITYYTNNSVKENFILNELDQKCGRYIKYGIDGLIEVSGNYAILNDNEVMDGVWIYYEKGVPNRYEFYKNGTLSKKKKIRGMKAFRKK